MRKKQNLRRTSPPKGSARSAALIKNESPLSQPDEHSLDLIANVASRLLDGDDYSGAAERAFALLDACQEKADARWLERIKPQLLDERRHVPFIHAVKTITGYEDAEYAREQFYQFFAITLLLLYGAEVDNNAAGQLINRHVEKGFSPEVIAILSILFKSFKRARNVKISSHRASKGGSKKFKKVLGRLFPEIRGR